MRRLGWWMSATAGGLLLVLVGAGQSQEGQTLQFGFEGRDPVFVEGPADALFKTDQRITEDTSHGGRRCEQLHIVAQPGSYIHYTYDVGRAPISEELTVSLWVKSRRPGVQLLCRVVLPKERDPNDLQRPLTVLIHGAPLPRGEIYDLTERWQQLKLRQPVKRLREQEAILNKQLNRAVDTSGAYVDRIVLNVYTGPGQNDVYLDDLEVGPLEALRAVTPNPVPVAGVPGRPVTRQRASDVKLENSQILVNGKPIFMRGIRVSGTPLKSLADAGFNTVWLDEATLLRPGVLEEAVNLGFWIVPTLTPPSAAPAHAQDAALDAFNKKVTRCQELDATLAYDLGGNLILEQYPTVQRTVQAFRSADPLRPLMADVWDGTGRYSLGIDQLLLGIHRWPLMTTLELPAYRDWLQQRTRLAPGDPLTWTWVQTHIPDCLLEVAYDRPPGTTTAFTELVGPQPEQLRLLAYTALGAGCRGLGFWSDSFLADSHLGRDRLLALALLNLEFDLLEPLLVAPPRADAPTWIGTSVGEIKAAMLRADGLLLVLPVWQGSGAQFVPSQGSAASLEFVVPGVPRGYVPWQVSPGGVRALPWQRVQDGVKVTLHEFDLTAAIVLTDDLVGTRSKIVAFQNRQRDLAPKAAYWSLLLAQEELTRVEKIHGELDQLGKTIADAVPLLEKCRTLLASGNSFYRNQQYEEAYAEAQRAVRPLRILMRADWEKATRELDSPVSSPYALSYYTLPRHWRFVDEIRTLKIGENLLPEGDFERPPDEVSPGWLIEQVPSLDEVTQSIQRVTEPHRPKKKQCLRLRIAPKVALDKDGKPKDPPQALERTFLALHSPAVHLRPGSLVRLSAWVQVAGAINASADGALLYDSVGGEPLAVRLTGTENKWKHYVLYRRVPATGVVNMSVALTGVGTVYFDDLRIEPLAPGVAGAVAQGKP